jgi:hypothetical protein
MTLRTRSTRRSKLFEGQTYRRRAGRRSCTSEAERSGSRFISCTLFGRANQTRNPSITGEVLLSTTARNLSQSLHRTASRRSTSATSCTSVARSITAQLGEISSRFFLSTAGPRHPHRMRVAGPRSSATSPTRSFRVTRDGRRRRGSPKWVYWRRLFSQLSWWIACIWQGSMYLRIPAFRPSAGRRTMYRQRST